MQSFRGTARYEVVRELGTGGMGVVYEAVDHERNGRHVALKVLRSGDGDALMRLKREFRALADLRHPNLAALYELVADQDAWFYTLELIDGRDFLSWIRPGRPATDLPTADLGVTVRSPASAGAAPAPQRLAAAFGQLAEGICFLHAHQRIHRDLKPSNVLVTGEGRVVILDFGLVADLDGERSLSEAQGQAIVGTAAYMAPEQAASGPVTGAADWYAFGVMLFQALTGRLPFEGSPVAVMLEKQRRPAPAPRELAEVPPELDALCVRLLRLEPGERPDPAEILAAFGARAVAPRPRVESDFVGRLAELDQLRRSLRETREGVPRLVRVLGSSGIGKSALVRRFTQEAEAEGAVVLAGRCYERETVPFKALDSVIDALARTLAGLPAERVDAILPRDAQVLARMFPVLQRVPAFQAAPARDVREPQEQRRRAVHALRELLARMADRHPVLIVVDDAHWGDADSAAVLEEALREPEAPAVLVVTGARSGATPLEGVARRAVELRLEPLGAEEIELLARRAIADDPVRASAVARESGGNPFLLQQLVELAHTPSARLEDVVAARLSALARPARDLLDVIAVAGTPVSQRAVAEAAGLDAGDLELVQALKSSHLVRGVGEGGDRVETWHDRIRETVVAQLDPERMRHLHARLADALLAVGDGDIDAVAWHLGAAGLVERAADATMAAARHAAGLLAFERAAGLFRRALELLPPRDLRRKDATVALGDSLSDAGRGADAARAYRQALLEPSEHPMEEGEALELKRRAAEQLLRSGHVDEGLVAIREVLTPLNMSLPRSPRTALLTLLLRRAHVALRGLDYFERAEGEIPAAELRRIDVCWSVSVGLSMVDTIRAATFQTRQLLLALDAGEPFRVARALAAEACFVANGGRSAERGAAELIARARAIAQRVGDPRLLGLVDFCAGMTRFLVGRWREAQELTAGAERQFAELGSAVVWEATTARVLGVWSLFYLGEVAQLARLVPAFVREAESRGDRYAATTIQSGLGCVSVLVAGEPDRARAAVHALMKQWPAGQFTFQHYFSLLAEAMVDLYVGQPEESWRRLSETWPALRRSMVLRSQAVRIEALWLRGSLALATGRLEEVIEAVQRLEAERVGHAKALATLLRGLAEPDRSAESLRSAVERFDAEGMLLFSAAARLRLAQAQGGELGAANERAALAWMRLQGVREPERLAAVVAPRAAARLLTA